MSTYELSIEMNETWKPGSSQAIVAAYGQLATEFCETVLITEHCQKVGIINIVEERATDVDDAGDFHPHIPKPSHLFVNPQGALICCVSEDISSKLSIRFARKLITLVPSGPILVLSSHHYGLLQGSYAPRDEENCVVHSLSSPNFLKYKAVYPPLPQPATVSSFPAAMLTTCMVFDRECVLYPVYTDTYSTGDLDLVASSLIQIFSRDPFSKMVTPELNLSFMHHHRVTNPRKEMDDRLIMGAFALANDNYLQCCGDLSRVIVASGGDSHAQEVGICLTHQLEVGEHDYHGIQPNVRHFTYGRVTTEEYLGSSLYEQLKSSSSNIVVLLIGGNDLDETEKKPQDICEKIYRIYIELLDLGKLVFVCESPKRFSTRHQDLKVYEKNRRRVSTLLNRALKNRFIALPSSMFKLECFEKQTSACWGDEYVHLKSHYYVEVADVVLKHIMVDLTFQQSLPSTINPY